MSEKKPANLLEIQEEINTNRESSSSVYGDFHSRGKIPSYGGVRGMRYRDDGLDIDLGGLRLKRELAIDRQTGRKLTPRMRFRRWVMKNIIA